MMFGSIQLTDQKTLSTTTRKTD